MRMIVHHNVIHEHKWRLHTRSCTTYLQRMEWQLMPGFYQVRLTFEERLTKDAVSDLQAAVNEQRTCADTISLIVVFVITCT